MIGSLRGIWFQYLHGFLSEINTNHPGILFMTVHHHVDKIVTISVEDREICCEVPQCYSSSIYIPHLTQRQCFSKIIPPLMRQRIMPQGVINQDVVDMNNVSLEPVVPRKMPITCPDLPTITDIIDLLL